MSTEEAKKRVSCLDREKNIQKQKLIRAERCERRYRLAKSVYLPEDLLDGFDLYLDAQSFSSKRNRQKLGIHWQATQKIIHQLALLPRQLWNERRQI
jgi:hypothetical protein